MNQTIRFACRKNWLPAVAGISILAAPLSNAGITPVNTGELDDTGNKTSYTKSFDASGGGNSVDKLIVSVATESNPPVSGITYHGTALTLVPGSGSASAGRNRGIWVLDNPYSGGAADLVVSGDGTSFSHMRLGIASISGSAPGYSVANVAPDTSVDLTVPVAGSFVFAAFAANDQATPAAAPPLSQIFAVNSDSAAASAGHHIAAPAGPATYSFTGNTSSPQTSVVAFAPADAAPVLVSTSPADDEINVAAGVDLVATFSEPVTAGTGTIKLKRSGDGSTVESFDVTSSPRITFDGPSVTIDPTGAVEPGVDYHVLIDSGAILDTSGGDAFAGIADPSSWNFTGDSPPVITGLSPADDAVNIQISADLVASFNEPVTAGTGTITLRRSSDNSTLESFDVSTSSRLTFNGAELTIDPTGELENGTEYHVLVDGTAIVDGVALPFAGISDPTVWSFATRPGLDTVDGRLVSMIQENVDNPWPGIGDPTNAPGVFSYALACLYLDTNVGEANDLLSTFYSGNPVPDSDTSSYNGYFWQHILWRLYHDPAMGARLTPSVRSTIEANMWLWLRTRSTLAEAQGSEWVIHDSENHDAMQKGSHLMCLVALKDAPGYGPGMVLADGGTVSEHLEAWTQYFLRYFRVRAKEGINVEIASPIYAKYSMGAYYNIMDFADSPALREMARTFIDLYWADTACDWTLSGVRGGGETRCYKDSYLRTGTSYSFHSLMWGYGWHTNPSTVRTYPLIPAVSSYRIPGSITACATDASRPNFLYTSRRFGRGGNWDGDRNYTVVFDGGDSNLRRDTFVTPDYSMGTFTVDMNKAYIALIDQNRAMGVMFASGVNDRIMVFGKGGSDPNKSFADISGVTRENCLVVQRDPNASSHGNATLVFLSQAAWDNRVESGGWFFTQLGNAFCAIKPAGGGYTSAVASQGYELTLGDRWAPVVVQMGQASDYPSFGDFQTSVMANSFTYASGTMNYTSEAGDTFTFYANTKTTPRVNGATVDLNPAKTYDSPYLSMLHGSETATFSYGGFSDLLLDFGYDPEVASLSPADDAAGIVVGTNLEVTFNEPVQAGTGNITIRKLSDDSLVEAFDVTSSPRLTFDGPVLTIAPSSPLEAGVEYGVLIDPTAVEDLSGNAFAGISDSSAWSFTTDGTPPMVVSLSPPDDSIGFSPEASLTVTFDEPVSAGSGVVTLRRSSDNSTVESFDVPASPRLSFGGSSLTIDPSADLDLATSYYVTIDSSAVEDVSGNAFPGLAGNAAWNFTTSNGISAPIVEVNDGSFGGNAPGATVTQSIAVGAGAEMLIVMTASELGNLTGSPMSVTYGGVAMNLATGTPATTGIWYLDLSTSGITGTNVVVDMSGYGTRNGFAAGWVSIDGNLGAGESIALHNVNHSASTENTVSLTTTVETFNVVTFNGNGGSGTMTVNSPNPTVVYTDTDIGSARSAAAYEGGVAAGTSNNLWTLTGGNIPGTDYRRIDAAAFAIIPAAGGDTYTDWIAGFPGVGGLTGLNDDPDGDGSDNGVENYFGTDPDDFSQGLVAGSVDTGAKTFTFTHPLNDTPASDLTATYRWSTDLVDFHDDGSPNGAGTTTVSFAQGTPSEGEVTVTATVSGSVVPDRLFIDVKVTQN